MLHQHWSALGLAANAHVLIPLCGKTPDMRWLAEQGHAVTGIELSESAAEEFFADNALDYQRVPDGVFTRFSAVLANNTTIDILVGDFFDLDADRLAGFDAWYDRAALIALPPAMRHRYTTHLLGHLAPGTQGLLVTFAYDQSLMEGPPFSVDDEEVQRLFGPGCDITLLEESHGQPESDHLRQKGLQETREGAYQLQIHG